MQFFLYVLPPQQFAGYVAIELLAIAITEGKDHLVVECNARAVHLQEVSHVDDVRLMNAQEVVGRDAFLQFLHAEEHHQGLVVAIEVDAQILAHALHIHNIVDDNPHHLMVNTLLILT